MSDNMARGVDLAQSTSLDNIERRHYVAKAACVCAARPG